MLASYVWKFSIWVKQFISLKFSCIKCITFQLQWLPHFLVVIHRINPQLPLEHLNATLAILNENKMVSSEALMSVLVLDTFANQYLVSVVHTTVPKIL